MTQGTPGTAPAEGPASTHQRLLAAAASLFAERGYGGTSMADIAERVGVRKASLYNYYPSKDELLTTLLRGSLEAWQQACLPPLEAGGPVEQRLFGHLQASVGFARGHADLLALIRLAATQIGGELGSRVESEVMAHKRLHRQRLERFFAEAVAGGEVVPGEAADLAYLYRAFSKGILSGFLDCNCGERPTDERLCRIWRLFWEGLGGRRDGA